MDYDRSRFTPGARFDLDTPPAPRVRTCSSPSGAGSASVECRGGRLAPPGSSHLIPLVPSTLRHSLPANREHIYQTPNIEPTEQNTQDTSTFPRPGPHTQIIVPLLMSPACREGKISDTRTHPYSYPRRTHPLPPRLDLLNADCSAPPRPTRSPAPSPARARNTLPFTRISRIPLSLSFHAPVPSLPRFLACSLSMLSR